MAMTLKELEKEVKALKKQVAASIAGNPLNKSDKPVTYHMPYSQYRINVMQPPPPEPYTD